MGNFACTNPGRTSPPQGIGALTVDENGIGIGYSDLSSSLTGEWCYIPRNVEAVLERSLATPHSVVLVRGHRRIGKTTTVESVLRRLGRKYELVNVRPDDAEFRKALVEQLDPWLSATPEATMIRTTKYIILEHVKGGKHLVLDEIQNASVNMQVSLQETLDGMALKALHDPKAWAQAGSVIIMGSMPEAVDNMLEHHKVPLYRRIDSKVTILPFDTFELCRMYKQLWGSNVDMDGGILLTLFTLLGGRPFLYKKACNLLKNHSKIRREELVETLITRELQGMDDPDGYVRESLPGIMKSALEIVERNSTKNEQIDALAKKAGCDKDVAFTCLERLWELYGLIEPVRNVTDMSRTYGYRLCDPALMASRKIRKCVTERIQDVNRDVDAEKVAKDLDILESDLFEDFVRQILRDRPLDRRILPHNDFEFSCHSKSYVLPKVQWGIPEKLRKSGELDIEIDILVSVPNKNALIVGSCKRTGVDCGKRTLEDHWNEFVKQIRNLKPVLKSLMLHEELAKTKVFLVHFVAQSSSCQESLLGKGHVFSLPSLIKPFFVDM